MTYITRAHVAAEQNRLRRRRRRAIKAADRHAKKLAEQFDAELQLTEGDEMYACSYCHRPSTYMGDGQDGDLYCEKHKNLAPGEVVIFTD